MHRGVLTLAGGERLCTRYLRYGECRLRDQSRCSDAHVDKPDRPPCPAFHAHCLDSVNSPPCSNGDGCWYPHTHPESVKDLGVTLALQAPATYMERLEAFVRDSVAAGLPSPNSEVKIVGVVRNQGNRNGSHSLLLQTARADEVAAYIRENPICSRAVTGMYLMNRSTCPSGAAPDSLAHITEEILRDSSALRGSGSSQVKVRVRAFPKALAENLRKRLAGTTAIDLVTNSECDVAAHVVHHCGRYYFGIWSGGDRYPNAVTEARKGVCRAYYKITEACDRGCLDIRGHQRALDIGASPGGWTQAFLDLGVFHVTACDPGALDPLLSEPPYAGHLVHVKEKIQDALVGPLAGERSGYDVVASDMNMDPHEVAEVILDARPLLRAGCVLMMSCKHISGNKAEWTGRVAKAREMLEDGGFAELRQAHLFANGQQEVTITARYK